LELPIYMHNVSEVSSLKSYLCSYQKLTESVQDNSKDNFNEKLLRFITDEKTK